MSKNIQTYSVAIATIIDNKFFDVQCFEGNKKECITFLNENITNQYFNTLSNGKIVINLAFDKNEFENNSEKLFDNYNNFWYTLDELEEMGVITLK